MASLVQQTWSKAKASPRASFDELSGESTDARDNSARTSASSVDDHVARSLHTWSRDLRSLYEHVEERFPDVSWRTEEDIGDHARIWAHKAIIYARAPKAFKDRYFAHSPLVSCTPSAMRSLSPIFAPNILPSGSPTHSSTNSNNIVPSHAQQQLSLQTQTSTLSVDSLQSGYTLRVNPESELELSPGDSTEMLRAQLEWLYTGDGFGNVVEWMNAADSSGLQDRDLATRPEDILSVRDKLGQDLTYMWRSKLYADVRIHLALPVDPTRGSASSESDDTTDSLSSTASFASHRFILASRSPYFESTLLDTAFHEQSIDIYLPTPPFTPAALHFCLGFIYAGRLDFSNRTFDLATAFLIHRAAAYLQIDTLTTEIEARIEHDFCHHFDATALHCKRCPRRAARVWVFTSSSDVAALDLKTKAEKYIVRRWGDCLGRDISEAEPSARASLMDQILASLGPDNMVDTLRSLLHLSRRLGNETVNSRRHTDNAWLGEFEGMISDIKQRAKGVLLENFTLVIESSELWDVITGKGFSLDILESFCSLTVEAISEPSTQYEGPRVYQALVSSVLLKADPDTFKAALPTGTRARSLLDEARQLILAEMKRRWIQIRSQGGFECLEHWCAKEVCDELDLSIDTILVSSLSTPDECGHSPTKSISPPAQRQLQREGFSGRSRTATTKARGSGAAVGSHPIGGLESRAPLSATSGLRQLQLSSPTSATSIKSGTSAASSHGRPSLDSAEPQARSSAVARKGSRIAPGRSVAESHSSRSISGSPRSLTMRPPNPQRIDSRQHHKNKQESTTTSSYMTTLNPSSTSSLNVYDVPIPEVQSRIKGLPPKNPLQGGERAASVSARSDSSRQLQRSPRRQRHPSTVSHASARSKPAEGTSRVSSKTIADTKSSNKSMSPSYGNDSVSYPSAGTSSRTSRLERGASTRTFEDAAASNDVGEGGRNMPDVRIRLSRLPAQRGPKSSSGRDRSQPPTSKSLTSHMSPAYTHSSQLLGNRENPAVRKSTADTVARSASSSTDGTEARTPLLMQRVLSNVEPIIHQGESEPSEGWDRSVVGSPAPLRQTPTAKYPSGTGIQDSGDSEAVVMTDQTLTDRLAFWKTSPIPLLDRSRTDGVQHHAQGHDDTQSEKETEFDRPLSFQGLGLALHVGIPCIVSLRHKRARFKATVKYIGHMESSRGPWLGIESDNLNRSDIATFPSGVVNGTLYFHSSGSQTGLDGSHRKRPHGPSAAESRISTQSEHVAQRSRFNAKEIDVYDHRPKVLFVRPHDIVYVIDAE